MPGERVPIHVAYEGWDPEGQTYPFTAGWNLGGDCGQLVLRHPSSATDGIIVSHVRAPNGRFSGGTYYYDPELLIDGDHWLRADGDWVTIGLDAEPDRV